MRGQPMQEKPEDVLPAFDLSQLFYALHDPVGHRLTDFRHFQAIFYTLLKLGTIFLSKTGLIHAADVGLHRNRINSKDFS